MNKLYHSAVILFVWLIANLMAYSKNRIQETSPLSIEFKSIASYPYASIISATSNSSRVVMATSSGEVFEMNPDDGAFSALPPVVGPIPIEVIIHGSATWIVLADHSVRILDTISREWYDPYKRPIDGYSLNAKNELWIARNEHLVNVGPTGSPLDSVSFEIEEPSSQPLAFIANNQSQVYARTGDTNIYIKSMDRIDTINVSWLGFVLSFVELGDGSVLILSTASVTGILNVEQRTVSSLTQAFGLGLIPWHTIHSGESGRIVTIMSTHMFGSSVFEIRSGSDVRSVLIDTIEIRRLDRGLFTTNGPWYFYRGGTRENLKTGARISGYVTPSNITTGLPHTTWSMWDGDYVASFRYNDTLTLFRSTQESCSIDISKIRTLDIGNVIYLNYTQRAIHAICYRGIAISQDSGSTWKSVVTSDFGRVIRAFRRNDTLLVVGNDSVYHSVDGENWAAMQCEPVFNEYGLHLNANQLILMHGWGVDIYSMDSSRGKHYRLEQVYDRPPHVLLGGGDAGFRLVTFDEPDGSGMISSASVITATSSGITDSSSISLPAGLFRTTSRCFGLISGDTLTILDISQALLVQYVRDTMFRIYRLPTGSLRPFDSQPMGRLVDVVFINSRSFVCKSVSTLFELRVAINTSIVSGVEEVLYAQIHNAYPVPASNTLNVDLGFLKGAGGTCSIGLYSIDGRILTQELLVSRSTLDSERFTITIDIHGVSNGPAILAVSDGVHKHAVLTFIKR
mgnify:CR=1 FL=1